MGVAGISKIQPEDYVPPAHIPHEPLTMKCDVGIGQSSLDRKREFKE